MAGISACSALTTLDASSKETITMAMPTTQHPQMAQQAHTQGVGQVGPQQPMQSPGVVGQMGAAPGTAPASGEAAKPVLFDDIDPILLARLYPDALKGGMADARGLAMKAGEACHEAGAKLIAAAQEPVAQFDEHGNPVPPPPAHPAAPAAR